MTPSSFEIWEYPVGSPGSCCRPRLSIASSYGSTSAGFVQIAANGTIYSNGNLVSSDRRLKADIQDLGPTLEKLKTLRGVYFKWKNDLPSSERQLGVIAQEVEAIFPEVVKETEIPDPDCSDGSKRIRVKAVDYSRLAVVALQGVKELSDGVDQLEERLSRLEKSNRTL